MARRKSDSPQKAALRKMVGNYMEENDVHIKDGTDVKSIMPNLRQLHFSAVQNGHCRRGPGARSSRRDLLLDMYESYVTMQVGSDWAKKSS